MARKGKFLDRKTAKALDSRTVLEIAKGHPARGSKAARHLEAVAVERGPRQQPERAEQEVVVSLMGALGFDHIRFSQIIPNMQDRGICDDYFFAPGEELWWEAKAPRSAKDPRPKPRSVDQERMGARLLAAGRPYVWGTRYAVYDWLEQRGYILRFHPESPDAFGVRKRTRWPMAGLAAAKIETSYAENPVPSPYVQGADAVPRTHFQGAALRGLESGEGDE